MGDPTRRVEELLEELCGGRFPRPLADLVVSYLAPTNEALRADFLAYGCPAKTTLYDLDYAGKHIQVIDLSNIQIGRENTSCWNWENWEFRSTLKHKDDNGVHLCLSEVHQKTFVDLFTRCRNLRELNLANCNINDGVVATARSHLPKLEVLDLSKNKAISFIGMRIISAMPSLQRLSLREMVDDDDDEDTNLCFYGEPPSRGICFLQDLPALRVLDLSGNYLTGGRSWLNTDVDLDSCLPDLVAIVQKIGALEQLILNSCTALQAREVQAVKKACPRASIEVISDAT